MNVSIKIDQFSYLLRAPELSMEDEDRRKVRMSTT